MLPSKFEQIGSYSPIAVGWADVPRQFELNSKLLEHEQSSAVSETLEMVTEDESMSHAFPTESVLKIGKSSEPHTTLREQSLFANFFKDTLINIIIATYTWKSNHEWIISYISCIKPFMFSIIIAGTQWISYFRDNVSVIWISDNPFLEEKKIPSSTMK